MSSYFLYFSFYPHEVYFSKNQVFWLIVNFILICPFLKRTCLKYVFIIIIQMCPIKKNYAI